MATRSERRSEVENFLLRNVTQHPSDLVSIAAAELGVSRQAIHRRVSGLVAAGSLLATGRKRGVAYSLPDVSVERWFPVKGLEEHVAWDNIAQPIVEVLPENVQQIAFFGFTEMVNNAIEHSESDIVLIEVARSSTELSMRVMDVGVGIFEKIRAFMGFENASDSLFELSKGKFTTDPDRHSGEGIFFASRMFDDFHILSGGLFFSHIPDSDWLMMSEREIGRGTTVSMTISPTATRTTHSVYDEYTSGDGQMDFSKTVLAVKLLEQGGTPLVSRSQAKRLLSRLVKFREVVLNFDGVEMVGQAFADEIFRVYSALHPEVRLVPLNMAPNVESMVRRAQHAALQKDDEA